VDTNQDRSSNAKQAPKTYVDDLKELAAWRDQYKPGMPIWMTEMGYDTGGKVGISERLQAARLVRCSLLTLGFAADKLFMYRESGSTPSHHAAAGLLRNDFSRKPSWFSYGTLIRQFDGIQGGAKRLEHPNPEVWMLLWQRQGEPVVIAWTVQGEARLGRDFGPATVTHCFGYEEEIAVNKDFMLTEFPVYISGIAAQKLQMSMK